MSDYYVLNRAGHPVPCDDLMEWGQWFETADRVVARTPVMPGVDVSTVFLGMDHNWRGRGTPILWETLVFGGALDGQMYRYESRLEAQRGHEEMCERVRKAGPMPKRAVNLHEPL